MKNSFENNLKSEYWEKFKAIFNSNVLPQLDEVEKLRKRKIALFFIICILVLVGIVLFCHLLASIDHTLKTNLEREAAFLTGITMLTLLFLAYTPWICTLVSKSYARKTKNKIANLFAKTFDTAYKDSSAYDYSKYESLLEKSELAGNFEFIEVDDLYKGNYGSKNYTFSDTRFKRTAPRGGEVTLYSGIVLHIKTTKPFFGHTKILEKSRLGYDPKKTIVAWVLLILVIIPLLVYGIKDDPYIPFLFWKVNVYYLFGGLFIWIFIEMFILHIKTKLKSIKITDNLINKNFTFTSSNKDEAKTFINKGFFEKLFELGKIYRTKSIRCAFFEDNIIVIIGTPKDIFEFGALFKSAYEAENYKTYFKEIIPIFQFLHYLKTASSLKEYLE